MSRCQAWEETCPTVTSQGVTEKRGIYPKAVNQRDLRTSEEKMALIHPHLQLLSSTSPSVVSPSLEERRRKFPVGQKDS